MSALVKFVRYRTPSETQDETEDFAWRWKVVDSEEGLIDYQEGFDSMELALADFFKSEGHENVEVKLGVAFPEGYGGLTVINDDLLTLEKA